MDPWMWAVKLRKNWKHQEQNKTFTSQIQRGFYGLFWLWTCLGFFTLWFIWNIKFCHGKQAGLIFSLSSHIRNRGLYEQMKKGYSLRRSTKTAIISKERTQNFKVSLELLLTIISTNVIKLSMTGKRFVVQGKGFLIDWRNCNGLCLTFIQNVTKNCRQLWAWSL